MRRLFLVLGLMLAVAGCTQGETADVGNFELRISDAPAAISDFDSLTVTVSEARVYPTGANTTPQTIPVNGATVDLTTVIGNASTPIARTLLEPGNYDRVALDIAAVTGVVADDVVEVRVPSNTLKVQQPFTVTLNETTRFVFDIHVVKRGQNGYLLRPVVAQSGPMQEAAAATGSAR